METDYISRNGETMTNSGIDSALQEFRRNSPDATKVMILLTDGRSTEPVLTNRSSDRAHRSVILQEHN